MPRISSLPRTNPFFYIHRRSTLLCTHSDYCCATPWTFSQFSQYIADTSGSLSNLWSTEHNNIRVHRSRISHYATKKRTKEFGRPFFISKNIETGREKRDIGIEGREGERNGENGRKGKGKKRKGKEIGRRRTRNM